MMLGGKNWERSELTKASETFEKRRGPSKIEGSLTTEHTVDGSMKDTVLSGMSTEGEKLLWRDE